MATSDEQRAAFEAWYVERFDVMHRPLQREHDCPGCYLSDDAHFAWVAWQACAAQQVPQERAVTEFQAQRQFEDWMWHNVQVGQSEAWSPEQIATVAKYVLALAANPQQITESALPPRCELCGGAHYIGNPCAGSQQIASPKENENG